ncbi:MAG: DEAD/DEAH box helicase [Verrucomicrobiota bacterium]
MEITEKWLGEIGGWQAMKAARGLVDAGFVTVQSAEPGRIRGLAGGGKTKFASGLAFTSRSDVQNLCTCPTARRGLICDHALAVVLAHILGPKAGAGAGMRPSTPSQGSEASRALAAKFGGASPATSAGSRQPLPANPAGSRQPLPKVLQPLRLPGTYSVFLPENLLTGSMREPVGAYVRYTPGGEGEESLLAAWLADKGVKAQSAPLSLPSAALDDFLHSAAEHPRIITGKPSGGGAPLSIAREPVRLLITAESRPGERDVTFRFSGEGQLPLISTRPTGPWFCRETQSLFGLPVLSAECETLLRELPARRPLKWLISQRDALNDAFQLELRGAGLEHFHCAPVPCAFTLHLDGSLQAVEAVLRASFAGKEWLVGESGARCAAEGLFPFEDATTPGLFYMRNESEEARLMALMETLGFQIGTRVEASGHTLVWKLTKPESVLQLYATDLPRLRREMTVIEGERWRAATRGVARITPQIHRRESDDDRRSGGQDWLAMEFAYEAPDGFRLPRNEVLRLVRSGQRSVTAKNGKKYLLDLSGVEEFEDTLRDVPLQLTAEGARISGLHADYFLGADAPPTKLTEEAALLTRLGDLGPKLRPYQLLGVRWLVTQAQSGRGGVLGDEMGLGKTVQSIAAIVALKSAALEIPPPSAATPPSGKNRADSTAPAPTLIVCPKSLTGNWRAEFEKFAPHLTVAVSQGSNRAGLLSRLTDFDVIITTYQLAVRDQDALQKQPWQLVLLDEASYIRNPDTDAAKALRSLKSHARLALTGTPVENTTRDLWSIYQFALPGYLGSRENFKERFEQPIQNGLDSPAGLAASDRLKKLLRPYFLRRMKREVLKDLPEKIEQVLWCDPSPAQAEVYRRVLEEGREEIKAARKRSGQGGAKMTMFTVLLRLRQACCDLRLTGLTSDALKGLDPDDLSGKWPMLNDKLEAILEAGGKVLIFSQFVQYLKLVRAKLDDQGIDYGYIDGSSNDREAQVKAFQTNAQRKVFLISLKAGGYGLNLTAADHVILLDPWWNPAVESQAIDRAHRIGQQRVVTAYRLAMRGTVEERILALQQKKRGLVEATLDENSPLMSGLAESDLEGLLE